MEASLAQFDAGLNLHTDGLKLWRRLADIQQSPGHDEPVIDGRIQDRCPCLRP